MALNIFTGLNFASIANDPTFKEASVRSFIIDPLLQKLGYTADNIVLEKTVQIQTGSRKQTTPYYADYALKIDSSFVCVIEAKAPKKSVTESSLIDQAFSYASHREIRSNYFALCNGLDFALFRTDLDRSNVLNFSLSEFDQHWDNLKRFLAPDSFQSGKPIQYEKPIETTDYNVEKYCRRLLLDEVPIRRQGTRRHFGVHPYFTKQSWDIVQAYIKNYSRPGDVVLDPFGGSGVTVIESAMLDRKGIHVDINPFANFLVDTLITPVKENELKEAYAEILEQYVRLEPKTDAKIKSALKKYPHPKALRLPKGSDVSTADLLFDDKQTAQLGLLKSLILKVTNEDVRKSLLLMFSGLVHYYNRTSFDGPHGNTGASVMWMYRYRIAKKQTDTDFSTLLKRRFKSILNAKNEMKSHVSKDSVKNVQIVKGTATNLSFLDNESVDYIYTDPPYGNNIQYLDLSAMWHAWLDLDVTKKDYELEAIEGGEHGKSKEEYKEMIAQSIREMFRVLKFDRWLSFVFAHKDPDFWHLIIDTAEACGFEYVGAVPQKNGSSNFHKRQYPFTVLSGQLIINFRKTKSPRAIMKANLGTKLADIIIQTIEGIIAKNGGATLEQINDEMIVRGLELGFLDLLAKKYNDITPLLQQNFSYDEETEIYSIPPSRGFKSHLDVRLRIRYYLIPYLNRCEREGKDARFDDIVRSIMPLLKNGQTPREQTILSVLEDIGERYGKDCWRLKPTKPDSRQMF